MKRPYRALSFFQRLFDGHAYLHRASTHGDKLALEVFEDLYALDRSAKFNRAIEEQVKGVSPKNVRIGIQARRADGLFGDLLPGSSQVFSGFAIARGPIATIDIGIETKILHKSQRKQISDRIQGLEKQADYMSTGSDRRQRGNPISVAVIGINRADYTVGYEGERQYKTDGSARQPHPAAEAVEIERRIDHELRPVYDEIIILRYLARNEPPFRFDWFQAAKIEDEYAAALIRILAEYDRRH